MGDIGLLNDPVSKSRIAGMLAAGSTQYQVAAELGVSGATISRHAAKPDIKALIDQVHQELVLKDLQRSKDNLSAVINKYETYEAERDKDFATLSLKYSAELLRSVGILPSTGQSVLIQQIFNTSVHETPAIVTRLLGTVSHLDLDNADMIPDTYDMDVSELESPTGLSTQKHDNHTNETTGVT